MQPQLVDGKQDLILPRSPNMPEIKCVMPEAVNTDGGEKHMPPTFILDEEVSQEQLIPTSAPPNFTDREPTQPLSSAQEHRPVQSEIKSKVRKVSVRTKTAVPSHGDIAEAIDNLLTLNAKSQQLVRELIDQLSK